VLPRLSRITLPTLIVATALAAYRAIVIAPPPAIVLPRLEPATIAPRFADPRVVTDEQLAAVLARVPPPTGVNTNDTLHALRLWGVQAQFGEAGVPTGSELRETFLDDASFRRRAGCRVPPLVFRGSDGIEVRSYDDHYTDRETSSYHTDDLVATLAEVGTTLDTPIALREDQSTVRELLETSLRRFHLERLEYEWTAIAYARYVFPERSWRNKYGEQIDAEDLVAKLIEPPPTSGPCNGLHRLEALAVLFRADEQFHALRPRTKREVLGYMRRSSTLLVESQSPEGYWTREWPSGAAATARASRATLHDKLLVTGHTLEWLALAPEEIQPPRETVVRAAQWLARTLVEMDEQELLAAYGPYTHAARALCLWRGLEAWDAWQMLHAVEQASSPASRRTNL
jgi:hypothetical protein